ncbi:hypothetical protein [Hyphomonas pacifica]|uniref:hypothetical protein n=1 Tax=Hyphomonas pacifica TaxID=1280941 RepID=UPI0011B94422|nr:hypothetical protein [Hyphomonas pacifica]
MTPPLLDSTPPAVIDVWNVTTFDQDLVKILNSHENLVRAYVDTESQLFLSHDLNRDGDRAILRPSNPYASGFHELLEVVDRCMMTRTIRAFHYTRLTNREVAQFHTTGIQVSTPESLRRRLDSIVSAGQLDNSTADHLYSMSPFLSDQREARSGKFWMTSHPVSPEDSSVEPLMKYWGGEVVSMWIQTPVFSERLMTLGEARIIEIAVPLQATRHIRSAVAVQRP